MKKNKILPELVMFRIIQAILLVGIFKDAYNHEFMAAAFHTMCSGRSTGPAKSRAAITAIRKEGHDFYTRPIQ